MTTATLERPRQLSLDDLATEKQTENFPVDWRLLTGPDLDHAWQQHGRPLPVPYGCLPL